MLPIHTILHPTDFSKQSAFAFQLACSLARDYGTDLHVLHVASPPITPYAGGVLPVAPEDLEQELRQKLHGLRAPDAKVHVQHHLWEGQPVEQILHLAEEIRCDLIVMGTHGRKGVGRVLLGSVAEKVVRRAPCPVVTVRAPSAVVEREAGEHQSEALQASATP